jgi:DNA replication protein DnaC
MATGPAQPNAIGERGPGKGKTMLICGIVNELQKNKVKAVDIS